MRSQHGSSWELVRRLARRAFRQKMPSVEPEFAKPDHPTRPRPRFPHNPIENKVFGKAGINDVRTIFDFFSRIVQVGARGLPIMSRIARKFRVEPRPQDAERFGGGTKDQI
jgi:hypothetical protein